MVKKLSTWIMEHRLAVLGAIIVITIIFASQVMRMEIKTKFEDLLPQKHPYIKIHNQYEEQLGAPFKVFLTLKVKEGDVYNAETLKKAIAITDDLDAIPGVDHNQVYSIASRKVKKVSVVADGIVTENFMETVPGTGEFEAFKDTVRKTQGVYGMWVARDEKALLFSAAFIPHLVDFHVLFTKLKELKENYSDANHAIHVAGEPVLTAWVYSYRGETYWIFGVTIGVLFLLLYLYFRNVVGVVVPVLSTLVGAIWGLGFCGAIGYNLEPLTLVIPLLIMARALSHSVQVTERYFECYEEFKEVKTACILCASSILPPGMLGIITDAIGILLIAVAPIPMMEKLAYICSFWALMIVFTGLIFTPVLISFFKPPRNIPDIVDMTTGITQKVLGKIAGFGCGKAGVSNVIGAVILFGVTGWIASKVDIGDVHPGSPILWPDSEFNVAVGEIGKSFPGTEELYVIVQGGKEKALLDRKLLVLIDAFQRHMESNPKVAATLSIGDLLPYMNRMLHGGHFKWETVPVGWSQVGSLFYLLTANAAPGDFDLYFNNGQKDANVIIWVRDHMGETIRQTIASVKTFMEEQKDELANIKATFQLASGNIGVLAAVNETVKGSQLLNFTLVMAAIFILCSITYRSFVAAVILMIPLNLTNLIVLSIMKGLGIGLNINTLPIISVGVGVGIDYGIYLLSRLCEESQRAGEYSLATANKAVRTTGKAIFFTATTMIGGVIFWYFLSSMRFQAEMGLLLGIIMFINMVGALILIPSLVYVIKPKFLKRAKILVA